MRRLFAAAILISLLGTQSLLSDQKQDDRMVDQVRMRLAVDQDVKGGGLDVAVKDGVVTIKGRVDTEKGKNRATKLAKKVKGVKTVDNQLVVGPPTQ